MSATTAGRLRTGLSTAARSPVVTLAAALATSVVLGLFLAEVGLRTGPLGVIALLVLMALAWVALSRPHALVAGLALVLPVGLVAVGPLELVQLAMALVVVLALAQAALRRAVVLPPWQVGVPLVAMLLAAGLATAAAHDPDAAFRLDVRLALEVLMVVALTTTLTVTRHVHQVARALVVAGGVIAGWALLTAGQVSVYLGGAVVSNRATGIFGQPNELGMVVAVLLVLAAGVGIATAGLVTRLVCAVSAVLLLVTLLLTFSRGAWLGALVGLATLAVLSPPSRGALARVTAVGVGGLVLFTALGSPVSQYLTARLASIREPSSNPYDERPRIWAEALRQLQDRPLTGQGPGAFPEVAQGAAGGVGLEAEHAHQIALTVAAEYGLLGVVSLLGLIAALLFMGTGARVPAAGTTEGRDVSLQPVLVASLAAVLAHGALDYPLRNAVGSALVWLLVGLLVAQYRIVRHDVEQHDVDDVDAPVSRPRTVSRPRVKDLAT